VNRYVLSITQREATWSKNKKRACKSLGKEKKTELKEATPSAKKKNLDHGKEHLLDPVGAGERGRGHMFSPSVMGARQTKRKKAKGGVTRWWEGRNKVTYA